MATTPVSQVSPPIPTRSPIADANGLVTRTWIAWFTFLNNLFATAISPALSGVPTTPTAAPGTNDTQIASTAYADAAVLVEKTRSEAEESTLGAAISSEVARATGAEALLAPLASPALTGTPTVPTATIGTNTIQAASTAFATSAVAVETTRALAAEVLKAPLAAPTLTGTVTTTYPGYLWVGFAGASIGTANGSAVAWNSSAGGGETVFTNLYGGGSSPGFRWLIGSTSATAAQYMSLTSSGLSVAGSVGATSATLTGNLTFSTHGDGIAGPSAGQSVTDDGGGGWNVTVSPGTPYGIRFFVGEYTTQIAQLSTSGNFTVPGTITGAVKSFTIPYPGDATKLLVHSSVEGPEVGVYYRGAGQLIDGSATITLPDYFESLTLGSARTVQLTPQFQSQTDAISQLAASPVVGGQFIVRASDANNPAQVFSWEVKAVRSDQPALEVVKSVAP